jgi:hypothetical protein
MCVREENARALLGLRYLSSVESEGDIQTKIN